METALSLDRGSIEESHIISKVNTQDLQICLGKMDHKPQQFP